MHDEDEEIKEDDFPIDDDGIFDDLEGMNDFGLEDEDPDKDN